MSAKAKKSEMKKQQQKHKVVSRKAWLAARLKLLKEEKALTRRSDKVAKQRQELPWVRIDKEYSFDTEDGAASLADLFKGRSQLLIYHFMFGPGWSEGCRSCSFLADHFDGALIHLAHRDVTLMAVSRATLPDIEAFRKRMGWLAARNGLAFHWGCCCEKPACNRAPVGSWRKVRTQPR